MVHGEAGEPAAARVSAAWRARAGARLAAVGRAAALRFVVAVAEQAAAHTVEAADGVGERALVVLLESDADAAARALVAEPPLFAAFFQNLDLLAAADPGADATAALVLRALELATDA